MRRMKETRDSWWSIAAPKDRGYRVSVLAVPQLYLELSRSRTNNAVQDIIHIECKSRKREIPHHALQGGDHSFHVAGTMASKEDC
jgi:hypothetical protein